ncbi:hypothetical protein CLU79DRAFT_770056, partial [Phycomyces nitens]
MVIFFHAFPPISTLLSAIKVFEISLTKFDITSPKLPFQNILASVCSATVYMIPAYLR